MIRGGSYLWEGELRFQGVEDSKGGQERRSGVLAGQVTQGKFISS
jgi:hypothetical protein